YFLVNTNTGIPPNSCHGYYVRSTNSVFLYNDALNALLGPLVPGTAGTIQNSQCAINGAASSLVSATGTDLVLNLNMSLKGAYLTGSQNVYLWAKDSANHDTGWVQTGSWTGAVVDPLPQVVSGLPAIATGATVTFT